MEESGMRNSKSYKGGFMLFKDLEPGKRFIFPETVKLDKDIGVIVYSKLKRPIKTDGPEGCRPITAIKWSTGAPMYIPDDTEVALLLL